MMVQERGAVRRIEHVHGVRANVRTFRALAGFFADCRRIASVRDARACLLGLAMLRGLMTFLFVLALASLVGAAVIGAGGGTGRLMAAGAPVRGSEVDVRAAA